MNAALLVVVTVKQESIYILGLQQAFFSVMLKMESSSEFASCMYHPPLLTLLSFPLIGLTW